MQGSRLTDVLRAMLGRRVVVLGDLMLDRYLSGTVDRISPEAPVPILRVEEERASPGGAANVAVNVAALGGEGRLVGVVGDDLEADMLGERLDAAGVSRVGMVVVPGRRTTVKTRILARNQQIVRVDQEEQLDLPAPYENVILECLEVALDDGAEMLILEDYNKGVLTERVIRGALDSARRRQLPTVVDPKRRRFFEYRGVTVFKPNAKELAEALGEAIRPDDGAWMERTRARLDCEALLLTLGGDGMALRTADGTHLRIDALAREVFDVSGAGDTVSATVAVALAAGASIEEAMDLANHAASIEVGKAGVATVTPEELSRGM